MNKNVLGIRIKEVQGSLKPLEVGQYHHPQPVWWVSVIGSTDGFIHRVR